MFRKRKTFRRAAAFLLAAVFIFASLQFSQSSVNAEEDNSYMEYLESNQNSQDYATYGKTVRSYIYEVDDKIMLVDANSDGRINVNYFDKKYKHLEFKTITSELPIFGAMYASDGYYYVMTGQNNEEESDGAEVIRITKFDKNWNKVGSCNLFGSNTREPFNFGSADMTMVGKYLVIRSCHVQYKTSDGLNHQTVITIQVDTEKMNIKNSCTLVGGFGYASHSFKQFARTDNNMLYFVDHGDAYPRGIQLSIYNRDASDGSFNPERSNYSFDEKPTIKNTVLEFPGKIGQNRTDASVGGFEISSKACIIAGNQLKEGSYRDVIIVTTDKSGKNVKTKTLTNYGNSTSGATTPQLTPLGDDTFMLLWGSAQKIYYTKLDANGDKIGDIYSADGYLSDCKPAAIDGKLVWYVVDRRNMLTFYSIDINNPSNLETIEKASYSWKTDGKGWWIEYPSGLYPVFQWMKIDGVWYFFNSTGYMASNEWRDGYWLGSDGALSYPAVASWKNDGKGWWFGDTSGWYAAGCWQKIDGEWYYFDSSGYMVTNQRVDGYWIDSSGICLY